jgi:hypothetical protein
VAEPAAAGEIVERALRYPYAAPERSFVFAGGAARELPPEPLDLSGREPLLAYGANAAPEALARKLAALPDRQLPALRAELDGFDVVYSAHVSPYGAVPATLRESPGATAPVFVAYPDSDQLRLLSASEPNYRLARLRGVSCRLEAGGSVTEVDAFVSRHGCLTLDGSEVALAAIEVAGRSLPALEEPAVLELVRSALAPQLDLEPFVLDRVAAGGLAPFPPLSRL